MFSRQIGIVAAGFFAWHAAVAQAPDTSVNARLGTASGEVWMGYSPGSTSAGVLGRHDGIRLGLLGMRWNQRIHASGSRLLYYTLDLIPHARITPLVYYSGDAADHCPPPKFDCRRIQAIARGVGVSPLGVTMVYRPDNALQWRLGANAGAIFFDRKAPSDLAAQFNFTAAVEGGVQLVGPRGSGVLLVYRLHHLSNAGTGEDNLAMLSHVISLGARWRLSR